MASVPLHYVEVRAFCYATEAEDRVAAALERLLPAEVELERAESEGHFGDPIVVLSARVERADDIRAVLAAIDELPDDEYDRLLDELDERVDPDCNLYVTLDKQEAFQGDVRLGEGITLRGKVEAYPAKRDSAVANARELLEAE
ncbi:MAG: RNA-binding protein [Haloplanus sp.]|jgi:RNA binding exosome subunit